MKMLQLKTIRNYILLFFLAATFAFAQKTNLATGVRGTLPIGSGGTGSTTATGTGDPVLETSPVIITPNLRGIVSYTGNNVDLDTCVGHQGESWFDSTDFRFEWCNLNTGTPEVSGGADALGTGDPGSNGLMARTAQNVTSPRTIQGTANEIDIVNGDGVAGDPVVSLPATINAATTGNAATSTALASDPVDCGANVFAVTIAANGDLTCTGIVDDDVPNDITIDLATLATTATTANAGDSADSFFSSGQIAIAQGGTGAGTKLAAMDALSPTTTKGDILVDDGGNVIRLAIGTDTFILTADSGEASGVKWVAAGGGGITRENLTLADAFVPSSAGAAISCIESSASAPKPMWCQGLYTTGERLMWSGILAETYGGTVTLGVVYKAVSATSNVVEWSAGINCITPGDTGSADDDAFDTVNASADDTVPGTAGQTASHTWTLTNNDSCAANDWFTIYLERSTPTGTDATGEMELVSFYLDY